MRHLLVSAAVAALLCLTLPAVAAGARPVQFSEHHVDFICDVDVTAGHLSASMESGSEFGTFADATLWLDPAIPFEDPPAVTGFTDVITVVEGAIQVVFSATFTASDGTGAKLGEATLAAAMDRVGDPEVTELAPPPKSNHHWLGGTETLQRLSGTVTFTWPSGEVSADCSGEIVDVEFSETSPTSFVAGNSGTSLVCSWDTGSSAAFLDISDDREEGFTADAFFETAGVLLAGTGESSGSLDSSSMSATISLRDLSTGAAAGSATASADITAIGDPVTSTIISQHRRIKLTEQVLAPNGSLDFPTGDTFTLDPEHCSVSSFIFHVVETAAAGPRPGTPPPNDTPDGAIPLAAGSNLNVRTTAAAAEAEQEASCAPIGRTVWYTIAGTGDPITVRTAGSNFDTVTAAFTSDGSAFTEVACTDDDFGDPLGVSLQGSITFDTVAGETYWIEAGGFFGESGRLRLAVN